MRSEGVWEGGSWNSGQPSKAFCSVRTNSLCREAFVISPERALRLPPSPSQRLGPVGLSIFPPAQFSSPSPAELGRGVSTLGPDSAFRAPPPAHRPPRGRWDGKTRGGPNMRIRRPVHKPEAGGLLCGRTFHAAPCAGVLAQLENFWEGGREERAHVRWLLCRRQSRALLLRPLVRPLLFLLPPVRGPGRLRPRASQPHV